jgi:hypothetical protein
MVVSGNIESCGTLVDREDDYILHKRKSFPDDRYCSIYIE